MNYINSRDEGSRSLSEGRVVLDRQYISVDARLFDAVGVIETCRKEVNDLQASLIQVEQKCSAYGHAYKEERHRYAQCSRFYKALQQQHEEKLREFSSMAHSYRSLQRDFEDAQTALLAHDSVVQEYERRLACDERAKVAVDENSSKGGDLNSRVAQLENENAELLSALANAADLVVAAQSACPPPTGAVLGSTVPVESPSNDGSEVENEEDMNNGEREQDREDMGYHNMHTKKSRKRRMRG